MPVSDILEVKATAEGRLNAVCAARAVADSPVHGAEGTVLHGFQGPFAVIKDGGPLSDGGYVLRRVCAARTDLPCLLFAQTAAGRVVYARVAMRQARGSNDVPGYSTIQQCTAVPPYSSLLVMPVSVDPLRVRVGTPDTPNPPYA